MDWKIEYPTEPGYYWVRNRVWTLNEYSLPEEDLCVVLVSPDLSFWDCASELMHDKSNIAFAEWYGPIEPPAEPYEPNAYTTWIEGFMQKTNETGATV